MIYHVLPGDAQVEEFRKTGLEGELIVFRDVLITGPIDHAPAEEFWDRRARFVLSEYGEDEIVFQEKVADELLKLSDVNEGDEVFLWFEYELFCSVNMWFCLDQLHDSLAEIFRIAPGNVSPDDVWKGFGDHAAKDLSSCFESRIQFGKKDIEIGKRLWRAFAERDSEQLKDLGNYRSACFPFLKEVCEAAIEIDNRPAEIVREIMGSGLNDIETVFPEFQKRAGVYGFGDLQVVRIMESLN